MHAAAAESASVFTDQGSMEAASPAMTERSATRYPILRPTIAKHFVSDRMTIKRPERAARATIEVPGDNSMNDSSKTMSMPFRSQKVTARDICCLGVNVPVGLLGFAKNTASGR